MALRTRLSRTSHLIAYNAKLAHLYLPGGDSVTLAAIGIASDGAATVLGTVPTAHDSHCVATDDRDQVYVCDPGPAASWSSRTLSPARTRAHLRLSIALISFSPW